MGKVIDLKTWKMARARRAAKRFLMADTPEELEEAAKILSLEELLKTLGMIEVKEGEE
jgi:hypothetical protein